MIDINDAKTENTPRRQSSYQAWVERAERIWGESARRLTLSMRYLYFAINGFEKKADARFTFTATDGDTIYYNPMKFATVFERGAVHINRAYMHIVMHCIFSAVEKAGEITPDVRHLWDLASDIHAEYILDGLSVSELMLPESDIRADIYRYLTGKCGILSVENIFTCLKTEKESAIAGWQELFYSDDHSLWPEMKKESAEDWSRKRRQAMSALSAAGIGKGEDRLSKSLKLSEKKKISYEDFLRSFMRLREESRTDPDSFDYAYYNYGLTIYGDMPLIEELETREEKGADVLYVVIDTSGSCADGQIERFLEETVAILSCENIFSRDTDIRLLQCDKEVLSDVSLKPGETGAEIVRGINVRGYGGTDFRPAFKYIRENANDAGRISGVIYFTDGYGLYPTVKPPWKTAFIFTKEPDFEDEERMRSVAAFAGEEGERAAITPPAWAMRHTLEPV